MTDLSHLFPSGDPIDEMRWADDGGPVHDTTEVAFRILADSCPVPGCVHTTTDSGAQQAWADSMTDEQREAYEDGIARRKAERGVF